jgi:hypothetical protein
MDKKNQMNDIQESLCIIDRSRDGQVMAFPGHKSHQVFVESIESSQIKSFYVGNFSLTSQVESFYKFQNLNRYQVIFCPDQVKSSQVTSQ